jgi:hypothetical protein
MNKMMVQGHKLTFLINLLSKNQDQNLSPFILRDLDLQNALQWKVAAMNISARRGRRSIYIRNITGGWLMTTSCENGFTQTVTKSWPTYFFTQPALK